MRSTHERPASRVAGKGLAPFFRFPGLGDSPETLAHLKARGVATFTVDIVSNDSFINSVERLTSETIAKVEARKGGIMLFHDIKAVTARALPGILAKLRANEGARLDASDIARSAAGEVAAGPLDRVEGDEGARLDHGGAEGVVLGL